MPAIKSVTHRTDIHARGRQASPSFMNLFLQHSAMELSVIMFIFNA